MTFSRNQFILLLAILLLGPFLFFKIYWILNAKAAIGKMWFEGHTLELQGISSHPVIRFEVNHDAVYFNGNIDGELKTGQHVPLLYQKNDPSDARIDSFLSLWGDTIVYSLLPLGILLVLALTPEKLAPLIPRKCSVKIGGKPFLKFFPNEPGIDLVD